MNNQVCKTRPQVINVNGDEPVFFPFSNKTSKCSGSCNNIKYPYAKICVADVVKNLNIKVFNLMPRTNETRQNGAKRVNVSVNLALMFVIINNIRIKRNVDMNAKNLMTKECVIKDLFGILVIVNVNVIKHVMLVNI